MRMKTILILVCVTLTLTHCLSYDFSNRKIQQGTILSPARIQHLTLGMSKNDAAVLMGTSLVSPLFSLDRWDYAYTWRLGTHPDHIRHLSLYFMNNHLVKIEKEVE